MSGSKQTQTTNAERNPWAPAQPVLNDVLGNIQKYGNDTSLFTPNFGATTQQGVQGLVNAANGPMMGAGAYQNLAAGSQEGYNTGRSTLMNTANGSMLNNANPYLDSVLNTVRGNTANTVNQQFSGAGRFGSASHAGVLADRVGAAEMQARMGNYNAERQAQLNASGLLHSAGLQSGQYAQQADQAGLFPSQLMLQAGGLQDQMANAQQQAPLQATQWMSGLGIPLANLGGTQSSTNVTQTPANVPGMILGGGMAALGAATGNPAMVMGGLGGLGGAAGGGSGGGSYGGGGQQQMAGAGQPFFGAFGSPSQQVYSQAGSAANGGWNTSAYTAPTGWYR